MQKSLTKRELKTYWMIKQLECKNFNHQMLIVSYLVEWDKRCN